MILPELFVFCPNETKTTIKKNLYLLIIPAAGPNSWNKPPQSRRCVLLALLAQEETGHGTSSMEALAWQFAQSSWKLQGDAGQCVCGGGNAWRCSSRGPQVWTCPPTVPRPTALHSQSLVMAMSMPAPARQHQAKANQARHPMQAALAPWRHKSWRKASPR